MAVNVGTAMAYLDLDLTPFKSGLMTARTSLLTFLDSTQSATNRVAALGTAFTSVGSTLTTGLTLPIAALGTAVVTTAANFESSMSRVEAISGATADDMERLTEKAIEMGAKTKFSAKESADAFTYMAMAGWKTEDMLQSIDGIMNLAAADGLDLATTSDIVTDAMTAFGLAADGTTTIIKDGFVKEVSNASHFADVLARASTNANTNVSMLGESFKYVAPVAGAFGFSVEDTSIALGLMANSGIKASQAGTSLRQTFLGLQGGVELVGDSFGKWWIEVENSDGTMRNLLDIIVDLLDPGELDVFLVFLIHDVPPQPHAVTGDGADGHGEDGQDPGDGLIHIEQHGQVEDLGEIYLDEEVDDDGGHGADDDHVNGAQTVGQTALAPRHGHAQRHTDQGGNKPGYDVQQQGIGDLFRQNAADGGVGIKGDAAPQITVEQPHHKVFQLDGHGIQHAHVAEIGVLFSVGHIAPLLLGKIAGSGHKAQQGKDHQHHQDDGDHRLPEF